MPVSTSVPFTTELFSDYWNSAFCEPDPGFLPEFPPIEFPLYSKIFTLSTGLGLEIRRHKAYNKISRQSSKVRMSASSLSKGFGISPGGDRVFRLFHAVPGGYSHGLQNLVQRPPGSDICKIFGRKSSQKIWCRKYEHNYAFPIDIRWRTCKNIQKFV